MFSKLNIKIIAFKIPLELFLEQLAHINSFQKVNGTNNIRPEDSEKFEDSWKLFFTLKCIFFQKIRAFFSFIEYTTKLLIKFEDLQTEIW